MTFINVIFTVMWVIITIILLILEFSTFNLVSIWFAIAAMVNIFLSAFQIEFYWQILIFSIISAVMFLLVRPFFKKIMLKHQTIKTNLDLIIGKNVKVINIINKDANLAESKVNGKIWTIICLEDSLNVNDEVKIIGIEGVKLLVQKINSKNKEKNK